MILRERLRPIILITLAVVLGLTGWLLFRRVPHTPRLVKEWARQTQETAAPWPVAAIDVEAGREEAIQFLMTRLPAENSADDVFDHGVVNVIDFLSARASDTLEQYVERARARGHRIRSGWPEKPRIPEESFHASYRYTFAVEDPGFECSPVDFFRDIYVHNVTTEDGAFAPVGISTGGVAAHIQISTFTHHADTFEYEEDLTLRPPGLRFWSGGISWSWLRFTEPPNTIKDIIDKHGEATVMRVLLLAVGPTGLKMPTDIYQCYDPDRKRWFVYRVMQYNFGAKVGTGPKTDTWFVY